LFKPPTAQEVGENEAFILKNKTKIQFIIKSHTLFNFYYFCGDREGEFFRFHFPLAVEGLGGEFDFVWYCELNYARGLGRQHQALCTKRLGLSKIEVFGGQSKI
jgi:hypothetical protein